MSIVKEPYDEDRIVSGKELARCFDELKESLGKSMVETITYELEIMFGIALIGRLSYKMSKIQDALTKLLGDSACEIMMESIVKCLDKR
jgi:hypothetical protein